MASESRQLPQSNIGRLYALKAAKDKDAAMGGTSFITAATKARLLAIQGTYKSGYDKIAVEKQAMVTLTNQKAPLAVTSRMFNSHFVQVFNLAVERGTFPVADRAFYKLNVATGNVPEMITDQQISTIADDLKTGETDRTGGGGAPMSMPPIADVNTAATNLLCTRSVSPLFLRGTLRQLGVKLSTIRFFILFFYFIPTLPILRGRGS